MIHIDYIYTMWLDFVYQCKKSTSPSLNPTWEVVQIPWIGGGGAKSAPP